MAKFDLDKYYIDIIKEIESGKDKLFYLKHLTIYLKAKGLPYSHPTIIEYEKSGIIQSPRLKIPHRGNFARVYTGDEIVKIGEVLKSYKSGSDK